MGENIVSKITIVIIDIALSALVYISINFGIISPRKLHEIIQESFVSYLLKKQWLH